MSEITKPVYKVLIDKKDITKDVLAGSVDHTYNAIDSYSITLDNNDNKYDHYFDEVLRFIEIWLGDEYIGTEKVLRGLVEIPIPESTPNRDVISISGLANGGFLNFQEIPENGGTYTTQTAAYIVEDIFDSYVEVLIKSEIESSSDTYTYDSTNKRPLSVIQEFCTIDECFFYLDPYDRFTFREKTNMLSLPIRLDATNCTRVRVIPDLSQIINYFTFKGDPDTPVKVTSQDTVSQSTYYKRYYSEQDHNFSDATLAQAYADEVIALYKDPLWRYEVEIVPLLGLKVNHKIFLENEFYNISKYFKIATIKRSFTPDSYLISLSLENKSPSMASIFSDYKRQFEKLTKDVQL